jgi:hypothetical protein
MPLSVARTGSQAMPMRVSIRFRPPQLAHFAVAQ